MKKHFKTVEEAINWLTVYRGYLITQSGKYFSAKIENPAYPEQSDEDEYIMNKKEFLQWAEDQYLDESVQYCEDI